MEKRKFGNTGMEITRIGFGAWAIGGGEWAFGWGAQDDADSIAAIHAALDAGINWIDTAAIYGLGHSETVVARALEGMSEKPLVFTKCSRVWNENKEISSRLKRESVQREVEDSLRRLKVEAIDLYQIHWPRPDEDIEEGWQTLADLKKEGKLRHIGVSNFDVSQLERIQKIAPVETLQPPYHMLRRDIEADVLPFCKQHNIGVIAYSPMASGLLTGAMTRERIEKLPDNDWRSRNDNFQEPRLSRNLELVELLKEIAAKHGRPIPEVSVTWVLRHPAVTAAIVGARHPDQIHGFIGASDWTLSDGELQQIDDKLQTIDAATA
ncbi:MAG TPA: aldo/keto reductase [Aggregatilineales bacterium]|nr:aldo/keto reductase [Aggregatilineales bacterium]